MSEEILDQESEEKEEMVDEDSSDKEEIVAESGKSKASVKVDEEGDEEEEEPEEEVKKEEVTPVPKTKNGMLKSVYEKLNSLKKDQLAAQYETILKATDLVTEDDEIEEEKVESKRTKVAIKAENRLL